MLRLERYHIEIILEKLLYYIVDFKLVWNNINVYLSIDTANHSYTRQVCMPKLLEEWEDKRIWVNADYRYSETW